MPRQRTFYSFRTETGTPTTSLCSNCFRTISSEVQGDSLRLAEQRHDCSLLDLLRSENSFRYAKAQSRRNTERRSKVGNILNADSQQY